MQTNTPPPSHTHGGGLCSAVMSGLMSSLVCLFEKEGDGSHLGHEGKCLPVAVPSICSPPQP